MCLQAKSEGEIVERPGRLVVVAALSSGVGCLAWSRLGLALFLASVVTGLAVQHTHGHPGSASIFLGSLTYHAGGAATHVLARRGFATTGRALPKPPRPRRSEERRVGKQCRSRWP